MGDMATLAVDSQRLDQWAYGSVYMYENVQKQLYITFIQNITENAGFISAPFYIQ